MAQANGLNPTFDGVVSSGTQVGTVAGGALVAGVGIAGIYYGSGAPTISAIKGSLYLRSDGSTTITRLYVNNGTTTWVAVTTAS